MRAATHITASQTTTTTQSSKHSLQSVWTYALWSPMETNLDSVHAPVTAVLLIFATPTRMCRQPVLLDSLETVINTAAQQQTAYPYTEYSFHDAVTFLYTSVSKIWFGRPWGSVGGGRGAPSEDVVRLFTLDTLTHITTRSQTLEIGRGRQRGPLRGRCPLIYA
jgi:hypothetical protein